MPVVQQEWDLGLNLDLPYLSEGLDLFESLNLSPLEELWKTELESLSEAWNLQDDNWALDCKRGATMIRVHDCMWAGTCLSEDHVGRKPSCQIETTSNSSNCTTNTSANSNVCSSSSSNRCTSNPIRIPNSTNKQPQTTLPVISSSRSILRKPSIPAPTKVLHRPDTPQSEDELSKTPDDHDLSWSRGVAVSEITGQRRTETVPRIPTATALANSVSFDHNYNTKKQPKMDDLGVVTPSDSEEEEEESEEEEVSQCSEADNDEDEDEEIDVVSLKPSSPPRKKIVESRVANEDMNWRRIGKARMDEWRRQEKLRTEKERRLAMSRQDEAVKYASQAVSKRLTTETGRGRGRQKRKRNTSDEEDNYKMEMYKPETAYKTLNYRKTTLGKPRAAVRRKFTTPPKKTRTSTDSETDSTEKRSQHNNMERMRRIDLRNAFEDLRSLIPSISDVSRAAKVNILRDAALYCQQLTSNSKTLASQAAILRKEQEKLRSNLSKLRRHIAHKHVGPNNR